jgi:hypothetical protein
MIDSTVPPWKGVTKSKLASVLRELQKDFIIALSEKLPRRLMLQSSPGT